MPMNPSMNARRVSVSSGMTALVEVRDLGAREQREARDEQDDEEARGDGLEGAGQTACAPAVWPSRPRFLTFSPSAGKSARR
jgi:hypothetical protein